MEELTSKMGLTGTFRDIKCVILPRAPMWGLCDLRWGRNPSQAAWWTPAGERSKEANIRHSTTPSRTLWWVDRTH